jgi:hypothetical protein
MKKFQNMYNELIKKKHIFVKMLSEYLHCKSKKLLKSNL